MGEVMTIRVNGDELEVASSLSVTLLLAELGLTGKPAAVERNGALVPARSHAETILEEGDSLEVVTLVGGG